MNSKVIASFTDEMVKIAKNKNRKNSDNPDVKSMVSRAARVGAYGLSLPAGAYLGYRLTKPLLQRAPEAFIKHPGLVAATRIGGPIAASALMTAGMAGIFRGLHSAALE